MQEREFEKLMQADDSLSPKWMEIPNESNLSKEEIKESIEEKQVVIPDKIKFLINEYIETERRKGTTERKIRRFVLRKWKITIV
jgi:hypothetical protein